MANQFVKEIYTGFRSIKATDATIPIININHNSTSTFMINTVIII